MTKITPNVFYNKSRIAEVGFGINIKTLLVFAITFRLHFFERRTDCGFHFRFLPNICKTIIKPGVKFLDLFIL